MKIYNYNKDTRELISEALATESPLEKGVFLIPANATKKEPLALKSGFAVCFDETSEKWEYIEDNRNKTVYSTIDKRESKIDYLGDIKDGFTFDKPTEFDKWENSWVKDIEKIKASKLQQINQTCEQVIISGFKSQALGNTHFYQSDRDDQINLTGLVTAGVDSFLKCGEVS